jgi:hypothetical protein
MIVGNSGSSGSITYSAEQYALCQSNPSLPYLFIVFNVITLADINLLAEIVNIVHVTSFSPNSPPKLFQV